MCCVHTLTVHNRRGEKGVCIGLELERYAVKQEG